VLGPADLFAHMGQNTPSPPFLQLLAPVPAGGQIRAKHTCRVNLKGKRDLAACSGRGRQRGVLRLARHLPSPHMVAK